MEPAGYPVALSPHQETKASGVRAIEVRLSRAGVLALNYSMVGDLTRIRIPPATVPQRADGLWRHTCFEAFIGFDHDGGYYEFNFSPSGQWAVYYFRRYREPTPLEDVPAPEIAAQRMSDSLRIDAGIDVGMLARLNGNALTIALAAVVEDEEGVLSYWALRHPPGKPDFHHPDGFVFKLPPQA